MSAYDREVESLEEDLEAGDITYEEFKRSVRELNVDIRSAAQEVAEAVFNEEMRKY
jgi:hypothetical protein